MFENEDVNLFVSNEELEADLELCQQISNVINHPARVLKVGIMPDVHLGYGVPIGCVFATKNAVIPNAVGVDIGCSMSMTEVNVAASDVTKEQLQDIYAEILEAIPVGFNHNKEKQKHILFKDKSRWESTTVCAKEFESAQYQVGTLGGGNHFIEIQKDNNGFLNIMIHSGSRNLGYKVCKYYNDVAKNLCTDFYLDDIVKQDLAFIPRSHKKYQEYLDEMRLCMDFASVSHDIMMGKVYSILQKVLGIPMRTTNWFFTEHNCALMEHHWGQNVLVHRKGAINAYLNNKCIIPGSQGTASYLVRGLGNEASLCSASHGSGRKMSRVKAKEMLNLEHEQEVMKGIICKMKDSSDLDEAPSAYKDIEDVIKQESSLVEPIKKLKPLLVVKG